MKTDAEVRDAAFESSYFSQAYGDYDAHNPPRKVRAYVDVVRRFVPRGSMLEVGCAYGLYANQLAQGLSVTATDVSAHAIEEARRRFHGSAVRFVNADISALPPEQFDAIAAFDVLEHIPDLDTYARRLLEFLKPGGFAFFSVPVYDGPFGPVVTALDRDPTHVHKWSRKAWRTWAARHGLTPITEIGMFRYALRRFYLFASHRILSGFSPAILFVFRAQAQQGTAEHS